MGLQKESLKTLAAQFHHLHKRSSVLLASVVMHCSGLIAAAEFQAERQNIAHTTFSSPMPWKQEISLYCTMQYQHLLKEPSGGCIKTYWRWKGKLWVYLHLPTPGHSPCNLETLFSHFPKPISVAQDKNSSKSPIPKCNSISQLGSHW